MRSKAPIRVFCICLSKAGFGLSFIHFSLDLIRPVTRTELKVLFPNLYVRSEIEHFMDTAEPGEFITIEGSVDWKRPNIGTGP